jgi:23S rRNA pseudouridine1911/1915/1917 synthase
MNKKFKQHKYEEASKPAYIFAVTQPDELMKFLLAQLPQKNRENIKTLLRDKYVLVDGKVITQYNHPLSPNQQVEIAKKRVPQENQLKGINIVYEDNDIVVIDKQVGLLSIATTAEKNNTAYNMLSRHVKKQGYNQKIFIVHRLDRTTSGLLLFAKNEMVKKLLQESWTKVVDERTYIAVTEGKVDPEKGIIRSYLKENKSFIVYSSQNPEDGQEAITHFNTIKSNNDYSLLEVHLETGRKNQIRVHMKDIGHPIIGDRKYGATCNPIGRVGLHAQVLAFTHPVTHKLMRFESPIPASFLKLFN